MSEEEQANLVGRLMREMAERKKNITLLTYKLDDFARAVSAAGLALEAIAVHPERDDLELAISKLPASEEILATCRELRVEYKRYGVLKVQASHLGL